MARTRASFSPSRASFRCSRGWFSPSRSYHGESACIVFTLARIIFTLALLPWQERALRFDPREHHFEVRGGSFLTHTSISVNPCALHFEGREHCLHPWCASFRPTRASSRSSACVVWNLASVVPKVACTVLTLWCKHSSPRLDRIEKPNVGNGQESVGLSGTILR
jgi:hypothetical protein